ncbi:MAG: tetratricopeptide repeat protein [Desulfitobacteriaceae bacterium]
MSLFSKQRVTAFVIGGLLLVGLLGAASYGYSYSKGGAATKNTGSKGGAATQQGQSANQQQLKEQKNAVDVLEKKLAAQPADVNTQLQLANAYYDLGGTALEAAPNDAPAYLDKAVSNYQAVLQTKADPNVMVDMATAAFYGGKDDVAGEAFKKVVTVYPDFYQGHYNYGIYLFHVKQDSKDALAEWDHALQLKPTGPEADRLKQLISGVQSQMSNPNPTGKTP